MLRLYRVSLWDTPTVEVGFRVEGLQLRAT